MTNAAPTPPTLPRAAIIALLSLIFALLGGCTSLFERGLGNHQVVHWPALEEAEYQWVVPDGEVDSIHVSLRKMRRALTSGEVATGYRVLSKQLASSDDIGEYFVTLHRFDLPNDTGSCLVADISDNNDPESSHVFALVKGQGKSVDTITVRPLDSQWVQGQVASGAFRSHRAKTKDGAVLPKHMRSLTDSVEGVYTVHALNGTDTLSLLKRAVQSPDVAFDSNEQALTFKRVKQEPASEPTPASSPPPPPAPKTRVDATNREVPESVVRLHSMLSNAPGGWSASLSLRDAIDEVRLDIRVANSFSTRRAREAIIKELGAAGIRVNDKALTTLRFRLKAHGLTVTVDGAENTWYIFQATAEFVMPTFAIDANHYWYGQSSPLAAFAWQHWHGNFNAEQTTEMASFATKQLIDSAKVMGGPKRPVPSLDDFVALQKKASASPLPGNAGFNVIGSYELTGSDPVLSYRMWYSDVQAASDYSGWLRSNGLKAANAQASFNATVESQARIRRTTGAITIRRPMHSLEAVTSVKIPAIVVPDHGKAIWVGGTNLYYGIDARIHDGDLPPANPLKQELNALAIRASEATLEAVDR